MGRITFIEKKDMNRNNIQGEVSATYSTFERGGEKYFQIDTYGTENREYIGQPSQKIQFDRVFAKKLVSVLIEELWP
jgi:hypothetical protein